MKITGPLTIQNKGWYVLKVTYTDRAEATSFHLAAPFQKEISALSISGSRSVFVFYLQCLLSLFLEGFG